MRGSVQTSVAWPAAPAPSSTAWAIASACAAVIRLFGPADPLLARPGLPSCCHCRRQTAGNLAVGQFRLEQLHRFEPPLLHRSMIALLGHGPSLPTPGPLVSLLDESQ